jgi:hypothetical protein
MSHAWQYLRLINFRSGELHFEPPTTEYTLLCAAVRSAGADRQRWDDAKSAMLDKLGVDGWELITIHGEWASPGPDWLIFKRELPDPT